MAAKIHFLPCSWENRIAMRVEIYGCPGNIASFAFVQIKKRRIKSRLKNVQVRGGYLEYLRHYFFYSTAHFVFASCHFYAQMATYVHAKATWKLHLHFALRKLENVLADRFMKPYLYAQGASFSFICPFINLFTHPFIDLFIYFHSFISLVQLLVSSFILFLFYSVWSFLFFVSIRNGLSCKE